MLGALACGSAFGVLGALLVRPVMLGVTFGMLAFVIYRVGVVRYGLCWHHTVGVQRTRGGRYGDAIDAFEKSEAFWTRLAWVDRNRAWLMGSAVAYPFSVLARYNIAYCLSRLGKGAAAVAQLDALLADHPGMAIARELRDVLRAGAELGDGLNRPTGDWTALDDLGEPDAVGPPADQG